MENDRTVNLLCHRCGVELEPGQSDFYVVRIESFADPSPPVITEEELKHTDFEQQMREIVDSMKDRSQQELKDDVFRRVTIHLCGRCYRKWIENPTGGN